MTTAAGKTVVLSGATGAIGGAIATGLAVSGAVSTLALVVRDQARGEALASKLRSPSLRVEVALADLARPASVAACAVDLCQRLGKVDALINNAATVPETREEVDGVEMQFAVNVLAYHVLMCGLLPAMPRGGRVVCVASQLAGGLDLTDLQTQKKRYQATSVYSMTKQANRMLAAEAAQPGHGFAEAGVSVVSCHPGVVTSTLLQNLGFGSGSDSPADGAKLPLQLALGAKEPLSGTFWSGRSSHQGKLCQFGADAKGRAVLWAACEDLVGARR